VAWEDRTRRRKFCCNAGKEAGEDRIVRDELIRRINSRRLAIQHASDGLYPYTDDTNAPVCKLFKLPVNGPFNG
jgi:hypothetical protein